MADPDGYFRFSGLGLRKPGLQMQIGESLFYRSLKTG